MQKIFSRSVTRTKRRIYATNVCLMKLPLTYLIGLNSIYFTDSIWLPKVQRFARYVNHTQRYQRHGSLSLRGIVSF
ncbi:hypothetical protein [Salipaludibacillus sp. CF4.18]|uniref:hypothetical protein n=1 Tax=Salipaludibacillus sp. CF4.18 TaxID=3373081 RepID=UPI003EE61FBF